MIRAINGGLYRIEKREGKQASTPLATAEQEAQDGLLQAHEALKQAQITAKQAQAEVAAVVTAGGDSTQARSALKAAGHALAEAQAQVAHWRQELASYAAARAEQRAQEIAATQAASIDQALADLPPIPDLTEAPTMTETPAMTHFHRQIAAAEQTAAQARTAVAEQRARVRELEQRQAELQARRQRIMQARSQGVDSPDHGAQLALIAADLETLEPLVQQAKAKVDLSAMQRANEQIAYLRAQLEQTQRQQRYDALHSRAKAAESALLATLAALNEAGQQLGHQVLHQHWQPTDELRKAASHGWIASAAPQRKAG